MICDVNPKMPNFARNENHWIDWRVWYKPRKKRSQRFLFAVTLAKLAPFYLKLKLTTRSVANFSFCHQVIWSPWVCVQCACTCCIRPRSWGDQPATAFSWRFRRHNRGRWISAWQQSFASFYLLQPFYSSKKKFNFGWNILWKKRGNVKRDSWFFFPRDSLASQFFRSLPISLRNSIQKSLHCAGGYYLTIFLLFDIMLNITSVLEESFG